MRGFASCLALAGLLLVADVASAQHAGSFSRIGFGARGVSMGNALAADVFGPSTAWYNPALAPYAQGQSLEASVATLSFDRSLQFLHLAAPLQQRAGFALGVVHSAVSDIDGRDNSGFHTRTLSVDEYAGFLAFGLRFSDRVSGGINLQFFRSDLIDGLNPSRTIGLDLGLAIRLKEGWALAFVADDLLARYTWDSADVGGTGSDLTDNFPRRFRLGLANLRMEGRLLVSAELESRTIKQTLVTFESRVLGDSPAVLRNEQDLTLQDWRFRIGAEWHLADPIAIRAGVEQLGHEFLGSFRPSAGFSTTHDVGELALQLEYGFGWEAAAGGRMHLVTFRVFL